LERGELTELGIRNKIAELTSYIASDWPGIKERKMLYAERAELEALLEKIKHDEEARNKLQET